MSPFFSRTPPRISRLVMMPPWVFPVVWQSPWLFLFNGLDRTGQVSVDYSPAGDCLRFFSRRQCRSFQHGSIQGLRWPGWESWLYCVTATWLAWDKLTSLGFSFLICRRETLPTTQRLLWGLKWPADHQKSLTRSGHLLTEQQRCHARHSPRFSNRQVLLSEAQGPTETKSKQIIWTWCHQDWFGEVNRASAAGEADTGSRRHHSRVLKGEQEDRPHGAGKASVESPVFCKLDKCHCRLRYTVNWLTRSA